MAADRRVYDSGTLRSVIFTFTFNRITSPGSRYVAEARPRAAASYLCVRDATPRQIIQYTAVTRVRPRRASQSAASSQSGEP